MLSPTMWRFLNILVCCLVLTSHLFLGSGVADAAVPRTIHYQGKLTEPDGTPLVGDHTVTVRLYDSATAGTRLWEEVHALSLVRSDGGVFSVILGSTTPFPVSVTFDNPLWLTIEVDGEGELLPRQPLSAASYAINADMVDGLDSTQLLAASGAGDITEVKAGVGLSGGATSGVATLDVGAGAGIIVGADSVSVDVGTGAGKIPQLDGTGALPAVSGANLTTLNAANVTNGTLPDARLSSNVSLLGSAIESAEVTEGTLTAADTADTFLTAGSGVAVTKGAASWQIASTGGGGAITGVTAGVGLTGGGTSGDITLDIGAGTGIVVATDAISVDVGTGANQIVQLDATGALPLLSGANLTSLNASNLATGTVPDAQLSSNVSLLGSSIESAEVTEGTLTAADTADTFLTAGSGVTVTKGASAWDISAVGAGGDMTSVVAGAGLVGGATSGDATLDVGAGTGILVAADAISVDVGLTANKVVQLDSAGALPVVSGANLTTLNASNLSSGTVPDARLSANVSLLGQTVESADITDGTISAVDTTDTFLTAGSGVTVTKGASAWDISASGAGGDITGVTAGTGLSGGGTSGDVTLALTTPVSIANGGTGAATAAGARANLINCMPMGGADDASRSATFQIATFGSGNTNDRPDRLWPAPVSGTVSGLRAYVGQAPGTGDSWVVTVRRNATNTAVSCTMAGTTQSCTSSNSVTVAEGDRIGVEFVENGTAAGTQGAGWSACFVPN